MLHQSDFQKNIDHEQHRKLKLTNPNCVKTQMQIRKSALTHGHQNIVK
jgi:hypothetical protein